MKKKLIIAVSFLAATVMVVFADVLPPREVPKNDVLVECNDGISEDIWLFGGIAVIALIALVLIFKMKRELDEGRLISVGRLISILFLAGTLSVIWYFWGIAILRPILSFLGVPVSRDPTTHIISGGGTVVRNHYECYKCGRFKGPLDKMCRRCARGVEKSCPKCGREMEYKYDDHQNAVGTEKGFSIDYDWYCKYCDYGERDP